MFGQSNAHRFYRLIRDLVAVQPDWDDQATFEADREKMLSYGLEIGFSMEQLFCITDPDMIIALWLATNGEQDALIAMLEMQEGEV